MAKHEAIYHEWDSSATGLAQRGGSAYGTGVPVPSGSTLMISANDRSFLRLFVLIRAANERVSKEVLLGEVRCRSIRGFSATALRGVVASLVRKKLIRLVRGGESAFEATKRGQEAAREARDRLATLINLLGA